MQPRCEGIVLCGGRSSRMGVPKAMLPFGPERLLQRLVRRLREAVEPVLVVASPGQELPSLPSEIRVVYDRAEGAAHWRDCTLGWQPSGRKARPPSSSGATSQCWCRLL